MGLCLIFGGTASTLYSSSMTADGDGAATPAAVSGGAGDGDDSVTTSSGALGSNNSEVDKSYRSPNQMELHDRKGNLDNAKSNRYRQVF